MYLYIEYQMHCAWKFFFNKELNSKCQSSIEALLTLQNEMIIQSSICLYMNFHFKNKMKMNISIYILKKYIISKIGFVKILNKKLHPPTEAYINVHVSCCISCILWLYQYSNASNFARLVTCNYRFSWEHVNSLTIYWQAGFLSCVYRATFHSVNHLNNEIHEY